MVWRLNNYGLQLTEKFKMVNTFFQKTLKNFRFMERFSGKILLTILNFTLIIGRWVGEIESPEIDR